MAKKKHESESSEEDEEPPKKHRKSSKAKRSKYDSQLITVIVILVIALITVITGFLLIHFDVFNWFSAKEEPNTTTSSAKVETSTMTTRKPRNSTKRSVCSTPECQNLAHQLDTWSDPSVDPCSNFYQYACGGYLEDRPKKIDKWFPEKFREERFEEKRKTMVAMVEGYIRENKSPKLKSEKIMSEFYEKCQALKDEKLRDLEFAKFLEPISEAIGPLPFWDVNFAPNDALAALAHQSMSNFGLFRLKFLEEHLYMLPPYFHHLQHREVIEKVIRHIIKLKGSWTADQLSQKMDQVWSFTEQLKNITQERSERVETGLVLNPQYTFDTPELLKKLFVGTRMSDNITKIFTRVHMVLSLENLLIGTEREDARKKFFEFVNGADPAVFTNFLGVVFISNVYRDFENKFGKDCGKMLIDEFPAPSLNIFLRNFDRKNYDLAVGYAESIRSAHIDMLRKNTWLDKAVLVDQMLKLARIEIIPSLPEQHVFEEAMEQGFEEIQIQPDDNLFTKLQKLRSLPFKTFSKFVSYEPTVNPAHWNFEGSAVYQLNYWEEQVRLAIALPYLTPPHFHESYPKYAQLASLGTALGRGIGASLGFEGMKIGQKSRGVWTDWSVLEKRMECLVKDFSETFAHLYNLQPVLFRMLLQKDGNWDQIIADRLAIEASWKVYKNTDMTFEQDIVDFEDHDTDQMFFRIHALDFCSPPGPSDEQVDNWKRPFNSFRVNNALKYFKPFADAFKCPLGSRMYPRDWCPMT